MDKRLLVNNSIGVIELDLPLLVGDVIWARKGLLLFILVTSSLFDSQLDVETRLGVLEAER